MDFRRRINPPQVMININHIRFITNKRDRSTFLNKPLLKLVPLLSTEATLGFLFYVSFNWCLSCIPLVGLIDILLLSSHECTFSCFHHQSTFLLNTHGHEFINRPSIFICVIRDLKGTILCKQSIQDIVHKKSFRHFDFKNLQLCR